MEINLRLQNGTQAQVACDGCESHQFALSALIPDETIPGRPPRPLINPAAYGQALFAALFPDGSLARQSLLGAERLALVLDDALDALPWEFLHGDDDFLVLEMPLVRLTPPGSRQPAPELSSTPLRVLAVPSNPVARDVPPLNIAGEWQQLSEKVVRGLPYQVRLERVNPPTLDQLRQLALLQPQAVIHFMGHGVQADGQAVLLFENEAGGLQPISAKDFSLSVKKHACLVTLNACVSATPGETEFSNLARLLVEKGVPYALGMRFSIPDDAALTFSRALYANLAGGVDVEEAVFQARRSLLRGEKRSWLAGVPVLYSSLDSPAGGFATPAGQPQIDEHQPPLELFALPRAEGAFQGRVDELLTLGKALTGEPRAKLLTIHGAGGQGKTALAREAAERFAHAWPGGVWAISLETKPNRATFCFQLAQFLGLPTDKYPEQSGLERALLARLNQQRALLVLDNAETFTETIRAKENEALDLAEFLREGLLGTSASLLVTSREPLGWPGEQVLRLEGLSKVEGAALFAQSAPQRQNEIQMEQAAAMSLRLDGHPLALLLLGLAFNETAISLEQFILEHETRLLNAENRYKKEDHRHRTLYASIETSVRYLDEAQKRLLSGLWIFKAPFLPETPGEIFANIEKTDLGTETHKEEIQQNLLKLARRGLLIQKVETLSDGNILLYRTLPVVRLFAQYYLVQIYQIAEIQKQLGKAYNTLLQNIYKQIDHSAWASYLALRLREDFINCDLFVPILEKGWYETGLGWILQRIGDPQTGLIWLELALEKAQGRDQKLELQIMHDMAHIYSHIGQPDKALTLYEKELIIVRAVDDQVGEAKILSNTAKIFQFTGEMDKALALYEKVLPIFRQVGDQASEATTLNNTGMIYQSIGQLRESLALHQKALVIWQKLGDWSGIATTLNNMSGVQYALGETDKALMLLEQSLPLFHTISNRASEATTLNNMASMYQSIGKTDKALELFRQALPMTRETGDRAGEARTLNNIAGLYDPVIDGEKALHLHKQALSILREVGDRAGEAGTLNNMAAIYQFTGQISTVLEFYEQALFLAREIGDKAGEATTLTNMAVYYYTKTSNRQQAVICLKKAIEILQKTELPRDSAGVTLPQLQALLKRMQSNEPSSVDRQVGDKPTAQQMEMIILTTVSVMTKLKDSRPEWRKVILNTLQKATASNMQAEMEFLEAVLTILDNKLPSMPKDSRYSTGIQAILQAIR